MITQLHSNSGVRARIRKYIREHGVAKTVTVSTLLLLVLVAWVVMLADWLTRGSVHLAPLYLSTFIILITTPFILHVFIDLILQLDHSEEKLRALSIMDDLTDVYNRRFFIEQASKELAKAQRYGTVFSILSIDIDHFKRVNDTYGHIAGDAVLRAIANTCMNNLRTMDSFARLGGDEFMFLIPESNQINLDAFAGKVLVALENTAVIYDSQEIRFTVSMGVKSYYPYNHSLDSMLKDVDEALYEAKRSGRNCIVVCDDEMVEPLEAVSY